ncbi:MAG: helix-turn-helix transcriptional regulator [Clostridia bacterium]|nr:helix-turn-helix transcriptional regulator [Clostridia bacterium]
MFDTVQIGKKIAELRKMNDLTQFELADKLSISYQAVSNWERGNSMPDISRLTELAEIFAVTIDEILGRPNPVVNAIVSFDAADIVKHSDEEICEAGEILKPSVIAEIIRNTDYDPRVLCTFLHLLDNTAIALLAEENIKNGRNIGIFLPYLCDEKVDELAETAREKGESINMYLPFMSKARLKAFAYDAFKEGGIGQISNYLVHMKDADILEFAKLASLNKDPISESRD